MQLLQHETACVPADAVLALLACAVWPGTLEHTFRMSRGPAASISGRMAGVNILRRT